jgi:diguanylate cyclase (GGDEF)-like protein
METKPLIVLAIDDDSGDMELLRRHLEDVPEFAVTLVACFSPEAARAELASRAVDVIILDYQLGTDTGLAFLQELRAGGDRRPIIVLTGRGDERTAVNVMRAGADDYLVKEDLNPDTVYRSLRFALARFESEYKRMQLEAELQRLARFDELTRVYNRRYVLSRLTQELLRARRYGSPLCVLLLDLDHFKHVNDTYGHIVGDEVLATVASILRHTIRATDIPGRYGGEEFCIVLTETDLEGGGGVAERLRRRIAAEEFPAANDRVFRVTCSIGVAQFGTHTEDVMTFLDCADRALYQAKTSGRNRVVLAPTAT